MSLNVTHLEGSSVQKARALSPAIVTQGGRTIWLSGQMTAVDLDGKDISWQFDEQVRTCHALMEQTLKRAGGSLASLVQTTAFILDPRHAERLTELRKELFPSGKYPCCTVVTVAGFPRPGILVEIQGIAVVP